MNFCRDCDRWLLPPSTWQVAAPESRELLALCLKKLKLRHVRVVDASFVWTEPHSRRIKVKITIQDSVSEVMIQQSFVVTYIVHAQQCPECMQSFTPNYWRASVQVRQKVRCRYPTVPMNPGSPVVTVLGSRTCQLTHFSSGTAQTHIPPLGTDDTSESGPQVSHLRKAPVWSCTWAN